LREKGAITATCTVVRPTRNFFFFSARARQRIQTAAAKGEKKGADGWATLLVGPCKPRLAAGGGGGPKQAVNWKKKRHMEPTVFSPPAQREGERERERNHLSPN